MFATPGDINRVTNRGSSSNRILHPMYLTTKSSSPFRLLFLCCLWFSNHGFPCRALPGLGDNQVALLLMLTTHLHYVLC